MEHPFEGQDSFRGPILHTSKWPAGGIDLAGKRVGVVGIGATGIQVIQTIADEVGHLTVFARTPQYALPMKSPHYGPAEQAAYKARFDELKATIPHTFSGFEYEWAHAWADCTPEKRLEVLEEIYEDGSLKLWLAGFGEMFFSPEVSEEISEFVRGKMRARLKDDPHLCDVLIPTDYGFGTHRVPLERDYLEVYLRDNVDSSACATTRSPASPRRHRAGRRHRDRARRDRARHRLRRGHGLAHPHRRPRPRGPQPHRGLGPRHPHDDGASACTATPTCSPPRCPSRPRRRCAT
jgi:cation diffusion facilitator CzcD-associated flavoprotein CzcO